MANNKSKHASQIDNQFEQNLDSQIDKESLEISEILTKRYGGVSVYGAVMFLIAIGIIWTAILTAEQVQQYHKDYMTLQKMKVDYRNLQIENQRLVIEQQTFSATPQIASRAVTQLGMYSPSTKDKLILQPMSAKPGDRLNEDPQMPSDQVATASAPTSVAPTSATVTTNQGGDDD